MQMKQSAGKRLSRGRYSSFEMDPEKYKIREDVRRQKCRENSLLVI